MASVDEIVAALADIPAADRVGWRLADQLSRLDEPVRPPARPVPDWFRRDVERLVGWLATNWPTALTESWPPNCGSAMRPPGIAGRRQGR